MALRVLGLLITLVLMAWAATALRPSFAPEEESKQQVPQELLRLAGLNVEREHQLTGTYQGAQPAGVGSTLRLEVADATTYCIELTWVGKLYHLRGPGGRPAEGQC
jgi:hypothetical protein